MKGFSRELQSNKKYIDWRGLDFELNFAVLLQILLKFYAVMRINYFEMEVLEEAFYAFYLKFMGERRQLMYIFILKGF